MVSLQPVLDPNDLRHSAVDDHVCEDGKDACQNEPNDLWLRALQRIDVGQCIELGDYRRRYQKSWDHDCHKAQGVEQV